MSLGTDQDAQENFFHRSGRIPAAKAQAAFR